MKHFPWISDNYHVFNDVIQHVWLNVIRVLPQFDPSRSSFITFIYPRLRGFVVDWFRDGRTLWGKRHYPKVQVELRGDDPAFIPESEAEYWEHMEYRVKTCARINQDRERLLRMLRMAYGGMKQREIAREFGVSETLVSQYISQVRENWHHLHNGCCRRD